MTAGMRLGLHEAAGHDCPVKGELAVRTIGAGPALALRRIGELIAEDRVDVVVAIVGPSVSAQMRDVLEETGTCMIVADGGADDAANRRMLGL